MYFCSLYYSRLSCEVFSGRSARDNAALDYAEFNERKFRSSLARAHENLGNRMKELIAEREAAAAKIEELEAHNERQLLAKDTNE